MKIAITGHTAGFGKAVSELSQEIGWSIRGFSRQTGHDIGIPECRKEIIQHSTDDDVFINNAYSDYAQIDLLYEICEAWKDQSKLIINIGSVASEAVEWRLKPHKYSVIKKALESASRQLSNANHHFPGLKFFLFKPGYMNTSMADYRKLECWIDVRSAARLLIEMIKQMSHLNITELTLKTESLQRKSVDD